MTALAPAGAVVGLTGEDSPIPGEILRLAVGARRPDTGEVESDRPARLIGASDPLDLSPVAVLALDHAMASRDDLTRLRARLELDDLRRGGTTILLLSHEPDLLLGLCDEVWWLDEGRLAARGEPGAVLAKYHRQLSRRLGAWARSANRPVSPSLRRGDGRASITSLRTLDSQGRPSIVWRSGDPVSVEAAVRFAADVEDPVVGIMIRTRIGFEVFGTNTELEQVRLGPVRAGETLTVRFSFACNLCPREYTLTAASHDPDGVWHDWLEDAVAFSVADVRYTAGVANLRAAVTVDRS